MCYWYSQDATYQVLEYLGQWGITQSGATPIHPISAIRYYTMLQIFQNLFYWVALMYIYQEQLPSWPGRGCVIFGEWHARSPRDISPHKILQSGAAPSKQLTSSFYYVYPHYQTVTLVLEMLCNIWEAPSPRPPTCTVNKIFHGCAIATTTIYPFYHYQGLSKTPAFVVPGGLWNISQTPPPPPLCHP